MTTALQLGQVGIGVIALACSFGAVALGPTAPFTPPRTASAAAARAEPGADLTAAPTPAPSQGLAGLRLGPQPLALIDGEWRAPGASVRGARLAQLDAHGITLVHANGQRERLWFALPPSPTRTASAPSARRSNSTGSPR